MARDHSDLIARMKAAGMSIPKRPQTTVVPRTGDPAREMWVDYLEAVNETSFNIKPETIQTANVMLNASRKERAELVTHGVEIIATSSLGDFTPHKAVLTRLLRAKLPFSTEQVGRIIRAWYKADPIRRWMVPTGSLIGVLEAQPTLQSDWMDPLKDIHKGLLTEGLAEARKYASRLQVLLGGGPNVPKPVLERGPWQEQVSAFVRQNPNSAAWDAVLQHAGTARGAKPTKKFLKGAVGLAPDDFVEQMGVWSETTPYGYDGITIENADVLKGLVWVAATMDDPRLPALLADFAARSFKKIRDFGPGNAKVGNACVVALGLLPDHAGIAGLTRLLGKVKYASARKTIEKALNRAAEAAGMSRDDLEELSVPDLGMVNGSVRVPVADGFGIVAVTGTDSVAVTWERDGKVTKSAPKALKDADPDGVKAVRATKKEVTEALAGQAGRIERGLISQKTWSVAVWRDRYVDHPLLCEVARRLIWLVGDRAVGWNDGWIGSDGNPVEVPDDATVRLWHPLDSPTDEVLAWRDRLTELSVTQPFKQAWREVYVLTPAEEETGTYSNRFAAHLLRQHPFVSLCHSRGWRFTLMGQWDSHNTPTREVQDGWSAEYWVEPVEAETTPMGIYSLIATDKVRILRNNSVESLKDVPARVFSELMRDVDLFVTVCSVGADEGWAEQGEPMTREYWQRYAFGDLSEVARTRREVLGRLLPKLKISDQCVLRGNWLHVQGKLHAYRIHLGSATIQVMPEQRYLCIVAGRSPKMVYLPFEGDRTLTIILSKAFLLVSDDKITDPTILAQL